MNNLDLQFSPLWAGILAGALVLLLLILWQVIGLGPRRKRGLRRVRKRLQQGKWSEALQRIRRLRTLGRPSHHWQQQFNEAEADCLQFAVDLALQEKDFDKALEQALHMVQLREKPEAEARAFIQAAMLEETRRLFSTGDTRAVHDLVARILLVQSPCREASFWQSLAFLLEGQTEQALVSLQTARTGEGRRLDQFEMGSPPEKDNAGTPNPFIDPPLYIGALLLRQGQAKEALRYLVEANRLDSNCPFVTLQLGSALIAAGGDALLAVKALQRAMGPKGLGQWMDNPTQAWQKAFPEGRSYVRKLASKYPFACPLWGGDLQFLLRQGTLALAQGLFRLGDFQEAGNLFDKLLKEGAPSWAVLRGLGLSLARLGKFDDAFKHLRTAHEMEEPKDLITAGYLALCGAKGKPTGPEDKVKNITWAIRLVTCFTAPGDQEWVGLIGTIFAEARENQVPLSLDEQIYLCEHLWSVQAADPLAAQAFLNLQATYPQAVRPEYAWLFARAAQQHGVNGKHSLELFALAFADEPAARTFFAEKKWDWGEVEFTYLARAAELAPGRFPENLGPDYPARGEQLLLTRSRNQENAGQLPAALTSAEILVKLAPANPCALDHVAFLHHRLGHTDQALEFLNRWETYHPADPVPLVRQAVFLHQRQQTEEGQDKIRKALQQSRGRQRAGLAFFGARLVLYHGRVTTSDGTSQMTSAALEAAQEFLLACLAEDPDHSDALWCLAAIRWLRRDFANLAAQASSLNRPEVRDPRLHFFAVLAHLAGQDHAAALQACQRVVEQCNFHASLAKTKTSNGSVPDNEGSDSTQKNSPAIDLALESSYLAGLAYLGVRNLTQEIDKLVPVAESPDSPSAAMAQALIGNACFALNQSEQAVQWWSRLDAGKKNAWKLAEPLAGTVFLSAVEAMQGGRFEEAAEKFRSAGKQGNKDRQLGPLLVSALFQAGQQVYYSIG